MATKKVVKMAKKNTFTINDNTYTARAFDFNLICDMEEVGFDVQRRSGSALAMLRAYLAVCSDTYDTAWAGSEINAHVVNGGEIGEQLTIMYEKLNESDFFRALQNRSAEAEKKAAEGQTAESEETEERTE